MERGKRVRGNSAYSLWAPARAGAPDRRLRLITAMCLTRRGGQSRQHAFGGHGQLAEPHADRVTYRIGDGGGDVDYHWFADPVASSFGESSSSISIFGIAEKRGNS